MDKQKSLVLCTFNCRSVKSSVREVYSLCNKRDIVFLQQHWLLPFQLDLLCNIHPDFIAISKLSVDINCNVLRGRPYGGTVILYRKDLMHNISVVNTYDSRLCAVKIVTSRDPVLMISAYMPVDTGDNDSQEDYMDIRANISALYSQCGVINIIVAGDFNCQPNF